MRQINETIRPSVLETIRKWRKEEEGGAMERKESSQINQD